jgi:alpha-amylase
LAKTGCVEFLAETYSHSLASLKDKDIFEKQVKLHEQKIIELFGQKPRVFRNTEMIYSDEIGAQIAKMGYKAILTEGAKHVLGWKSSNFVYANAINPRLKVLMRNFNFSDDISFRFSNTNWGNYPLTAEKFIRLLEDIEPQDEVINLFLGYESFGERQPKESGIFEFLKTLPQAIIKNKNLKFATPTEVVEELQPVSVISVPHPISWADEERDLTAWLGNKMQKEAFEKLYELRFKMEECNNLELIKDWNYLQVSDHFYYMSTKQFSDGEVHSSFNPFDSPYEAFINYMNVLSDFRIRLNSLIPDDKTENEINSLRETLDKKEEIIKSLKLQLNKQQKGNTKI